MSEDDNTQYDQTNRMPLRMIVSDLDGTLFSKSGIPTQRNIKALQLLSNAGMEVAIASGRSLSAMLETKNLLGIQMPMIGFNGSVVLSDDGSLISCNPLKRHIIERVIELARRKGHVTNWYIGPNIGKNSENVPIESMVVIAACEAPHHQSLVDRYIQLTRMQYQYVNDAYSELIRCSENAPPPKLVVLTGDKDCEEFYNESLKLFDTSEVHIIKEFWFVEFMSPSTHKHSALTALLDSNWNALKGISLDEICAFGDGSNDSEMLHQAGCGIAMGNAVPICKELSNYASTRTNVEDAVAYELHRLVSQGRMRAVDGTTIDRELLASLFPEL